MTKTNKPAARNWPEIKMHADHVRNVLIANNKTAVVNDRLDPLLHKYYLGSRTSKLKASFEILLLDLVESHENLFFSEGKP